MASEEAEVPEEDVVTPSTTSFSVQADNWTAQEVVLVSWCPTMDLVAIVLADNSVWIHRLSFERLFVLQKEEKQITSVAWRPDGKALALGYIDGGRTIWNVENGEKLHTVVGEAPAAGNVDSTTNDTNGTKNVGQEEEEEQLYRFQRDDEDDEMQLSGDASVSMNTNESVHQTQSTSDKVENLSAHKASMKGFHWIQDQRPASAIASAAYQSRISALVPPLKPFEDTDEGTSLPSHQRQQGSNYSSQASNLNILVSYDDDGDIVLTAQGVFSLGRINALQVLQEAFPQKQKWISAKVLDATFSDDLSGLFLILNGNAGPVEKLVLLRLDTSILSSRRKEIERISWQSVVINETMAYLHTACDRLQKQWSGTSSQLTQKLQQLQQMLQAENFSTTPEQEFTQLILCGTAANPTVQFLNHSMRAGAKRFGKIYDQTFENVDQIMFNHVQPAIQSLFAQLSQLEAMAAWKERMEAVGFDFKQVKDAKEIIGKLALRVETLLRELSQYRIEYPDLHPKRFRAIATLEIDGDAMQRQQQARALQAKLRCDETKIMALFKSNGLSYDPISAIIGDLEAEKKSKQRKNAHSTLHQHHHRNVRTRLFDESFASDEFTLPSESVVKLLADAQRAVQLAFDSVGHCLSQRLCAHPRSIPLLLHNRADEVRHVLHQNLPEKDILFAFQQESTVWLLRFEGSSMQWLVSGFSAPEDAAIFSACFYSQLSMALVSGPAEDPASPEKQKQKQIDLSTFSLNEIEFSTVELEQVNKCDGLPNFFDNIVMARPFENAFEQLFALKQRRFEHNGQNSSVRLAVVPPRGRGGGLAALVLGNSRRAILLDLESEEEVPVEEEEVVN